MILTQLHNEGNSDEDADRFNFDSWIKDNKLTEIKECLMHYNMTNVHTLDLNSNNALQMLADERIKSKAHMIPTLMSCIIKLRISQPIEASRTVSQIAESTLSVANTQTPPISPLSALAGRSFFAPTALSLNALTEVPSLAENHSNKSVEAVTETVAGINIALSGLNIHNCNRSNFHMNEIETYSKQNMTNALEKETLNQNKKYDIKSMWILNCCFYVFLILFIVFYATDQHNLSWLFVGFMCVIWCLYTFEWNQWMILNPHHLINKNMMIYDKETVCKEIKRLIDEAPIIKWRTRCCYTKKQNCNENDLDADEIRIETLQKDKTYSYTSWKDVSCIFAEKNLDEYAFTKLSIHKTFQFVDDVIKDDYYHRAELFRRENDNNDDNQYFEQWVELQAWIGHKFTSETYKQRTAHILVKRNCKENIRWMTKLYFAVFSCLMCSACYRAYISSKMKIEKMEYVIRKEISL